jgi:hypothetical protein
VVGEVPETKNFEIYPCGQTVMRNPSTGFGDPVLPCKDARGKRCFEDRLKGERESRIFFVIPFDYQGGEGSWTEEGIEFTATPISRYQVVDAALITARRVSGDFHPSIQRFVYSLRDGLLTAIVGDGITPETRIYVLEGRGGIFSHYDVR